MRFLRIAIVSLIAAVIAFPVAPPAAAANTTLEAESMVVSPAGAGTVIADSTASGGEALELTKNSSASINLSLPASVSVVVRAKGKSCFGAPDMTVAIDGAGISATAISATSWTSYTSAANIAAGTHTLSIEFTNAAAGFGCRRDLYLDNVTVVAGSDGSGGTNKTTVQPTGVPGNWTLKLDDEFSESALSPALWASCWFSPACGKMNNVTTAPSNVALSNGILVLSLASSTSGALVSTNPIGGATSGYQFTTGVVEARIFFPGNGTACYNWPGFWVTGQSWPTNGENDIAEVLSGQMTVNYHSSSGTHNQGAVPGYWCGGYHVYTLNRQAGKSYVYYDGQLVKSYATDDNSAPQYVVINVGANSPATYPAYGSASRIGVDYVRAWQ